MNRHLEMLLRAQPLFFLLLAQAVMGQEPDDLILSTQGKCVREIAVNHEFPNKRNSPLKKGTTTIRFDKTGRVVQRETRDGSGNLTANIMTKYDKAGKIESERYTFSETSSDKPQHWVYSHVGLETLITILDPTGTVLSTERKWTDAEGSQFHEICDGQGRPETKEVSLLDKDGRLREKRLFRNGNRQPETRDVYTRDAAGRVTTIEFYQRFGRDALERYLGKEHSSYNGEGALKEEIGYTSNGSVRWTRIFSYDKSGNKTEEQVSSNGIMSSRAKYFYNSKGDWIRIEEYDCIEKEGHSLCSLSKVTQRRIVYCQ